MRVRKKKSGDARFLAQKDITLEYDREAPEMIHLNEVFPEYSRFRIEIGCGKGSFIVEEAKRNPDVAFVAVEKVRDVIIFAMEKVTAAGLANVRFLCADAEKLDKLFAADTFERIYINFCDPWPKARHAKRRLTYRKFLEKFKPLLRDDGDVAFKTDNRALFDFSLEEFPAAGFELCDVTFDLHASEWAEENIMTEYEKNFSEKGFKINRLVAYKAK
ncbi:MAG: tRNA (guanosine(46)-N7)-methyltransferase TrmB [Eubacteriales bacterium]